MRRLILFSLAAFLMLGGCSNEKKPNAANFSKAINQYLARHGQTCNFFAQTFPIDIPASELKDQYGTAAQMAALEQAGLVHGSNTTAVIHGMMGPYTQSEVTYTYKIADLAPWAKRADVQQAFGDIRTTVSGISKANEMAGLQLANKGWEVPEP